MGKSATPIWVSAIAALVVAVVGGAVASQRYSSIHGQYRPCVYDPNVPGPNCSIPGGDYTSVWVIGGISAGITVLLVLFVLIALAVRVGTSRD